MDEALARVKNMKDLEDVVEHVQRYWCNTGKSSAKMQFKILRDVASRRVHLQLQCYSYCYSYSVTVTVLQTLMISGTPRARSHIYIHWTRNAGAAAGCMQQRNGNPVLT
jgi:hypothetical protein